MLTLFLVGSMAEFEWIAKVSPGFGGFDFPYERADVVFVGIPLDVTSSYRPGYRFAPAKIREASANLETFIPSVGVDVFEALNIADLGDLLVTPTGILETGERIEKIVRKIRRDGKLPFLLGGEHTLTLFSTRTLDNAFVIQLDAHRDLRDEYMGDRVCHATVVRRILDRVPAERVIQLGVRSWSKEEEEWLKSRALRAYTPEEISRDLEGVLKDVERSVGSGSLYLTIDLDVLDPAFAPAVGTPEPGGLSVAEVLKIVRRLSGLNLAGVDIVELVPPYDNGNTAFVAARIAYEILAAWGRRLRSV